VLFSQWKNQEKYKAQQKQYRQEAKTKIYATKAIWRANNPDKLQEYNFRSKCKQAGVDYRDAY
jgi:hypothetical protein